MEGRRRKNREERLLEDLREGRPLPGRSRAELVALLAVPTVLAELSTIAMEYIDAGMVGRIGKSGAAAIGLVASTTWFFWGLLRGATTGFSVIVSQRIGARRFREARAALLQGVAASFAFAALLGALGAAIAAPLPRWLGGSPEIARDATRYFAAYMAFGLPVTVLHILGARMLQAAGDMRTASVFNVLACALDVAFNFVFIFPTTRFAFRGASIVLPGLGLGVLGAAIGTIAAEAVVAAALAWALFARHPILGLRRGEPLRFEKAVLREALRIGLPVAGESAVMTGAMVASTAIVAPLGTVALAANSFAVTAESLCYMPGYGIGSAATTLVGQAFGAGRRALARSLAWTCTWTGVGVMTATGALLFAFAPEAMALLTPDADVRAAGAEVLRIEAFAEPMFAASIVASGALRGAGDTLVPGALNALSMWGVRLPLAALLVGRHGLRGVWIAMALELCVRGAMLLARQHSRSWSRRRAGGAGKGTGT